MPKLFLTECDQIIDLDYVAAIEIFDGPGKSSSLQFHLATGVTVVSLHSCHESAVTEKWDAFQQMVPCNASTPLGFSKGRAGTTTPCPA